MVTFREEGVREHQERAAECERPSGGLDKKTSDTGGSSTPSGRGSTGTLFEGRSGALRVKVGTGDLLVQSMSLERRERASNSSSLLPPLPGHSQNDANWWKPGRQGAGRRGTRDGGDHAHGTRSIFCIWSGADGNTVAEKKPGTVGRAWNSISTGRSNEGRARPP